jgi:hypothetical protein
LRRIAFWPAECKPFDHRGGHRAEVEIDAPHSNGRRLATNRAYQALGQITDSRDLFNQRVDYLVLLSVLCVAFKQSHRK